MGLGECLIGAAELRNVTQVIRSQTLFRYYGVGNAPHPNSFASRVERAGEKMNGVAYALGVSSGTAALELALSETASLDDRALAIRFLGLGIGDTSDALPKLESLIRLMTPAELQVAVVETFSQVGGEASFERLFQSWPSLTPLLSRRRR